MVRVRPSSRRSLLESCLASFAAAAASRACATARASASTTLSSSCFVAALDFASDASSSAAHAASAARKAVCAAAATRRTAAARRGALQAAHERRRAGSWLGLRIGGQPWGEGSGRRVCPCVKHNVQRPGGLRDERGGEVGRGRGERRSSGAGARPPAQPRARLATRLDKDLRDRRAHAVDEQRVVAISSAESRDLYALKCDSNVAFILAAADRRALADW
jgi:hypothetical protein